ncbi:MAG: hypothetical protein ABS76_20910 [Pelagibacterium sp. SCN 64-44]|nr:MAG: hypothetical protein ABS76_20910 [Pelagibacterium sp. SCN 64-44]
MRSIAFAAFLLAATPALANDTTAQLGTGGLVFVTNETIEMASEHLFVSPEEIKVVYEFNNTLDTPQHILIAFPMPDIEGGPESMAAIPGLYDAETGEPANDPDNLFGFRTTFNGAPVEAELHQYAFHNNIDYSALLAGYGLPLNPLLDATAKAVNALSPKQQDRLRHHGLVYGMEYDAGSGWQTDLIPLWSLRSTYSWEATFPPGKSEVVHTYRPSVGGTVGVTFMHNEDGDTYGQERLSEYRRKYCIEDDFLAAVAKTANDQDGWTSYDYIESWISYIWSTGNNWSGPIGKFTLTIDKGKPDSLVSFCGENVRKIGPTTFEMTQTDWYPPWDRELEILILEKVDWYDE